MACQSLLRCALVLGALSFALVFGLDTSAFDGERLTVKPAAKPATAAAALKPGDEIRTGAGERKRVLLDNGVVLYVNQNSKAEYVNAGRVTLDQGEVFAEVPRLAKDFQVRAHMAGIEGRDGHWLVRADSPREPLFAVLRGEARMTRMEEPLRAGFQTRGDGATPLPRASHVLDWTRELMTAEAGPLVPGSEFAGGKLLAVDPQGQEAKITLRKFHLDVHVEDGFARTTIDQTYFNHENGQLEGTFYFPLPADASLSRLAMYVDGVLMEGGMAERDYARNVYETIRYTNRDPALLEWLDGTTFKMRVFPLEPRSEKRLILSYTQKLPVFAGQTTYRFPAGHSLQTVDQWSCQVRVKDGKRTAWNSTSQAFKDKAVENDLVLDASAKNARTDRDVVLTLTEANKDKDAPSPVQFFSTSQDGAEYLMVKWRPTMTSAGRAANDKSHKWMILFEASGDRDPLLARTQIEVIRHFLSHAEPTDTFLIAAANTRVRFHAETPQPVSKENIAKAVEFLEKTHLIGALDLAGALKSIKDKTPAEADATVIHVGSGIPVLGERRADELAKLMPRPVYESAPSDPKTQATRVFKISDGARYVGIGVGRRWNRALMKSAAERSGGLFTQINPDEPIGWRAFDLYATLATPRLLNAEVTAILEDQGEAPEFLAFGSMVAQGEELVAITRMGKPFIPSADARATASGKVKSVRVRGHVDGKLIEQTVPVERVKLKADAIPRMWAKLEIDRLLALDPVKHKDIIVAISKAMYVMSPYTSLLVLEHEDLYKQYNVDRGRKDHWAMYPCPEKIPVVYEPEVGSDPKGNKKPTARQVLATIAGYEERGGPPKANGRGNQATEPEIAFPLIRGNDAISRKVSELRVRPVGDLLIPMKLGDPNDGVPHYLEVFGRPQQMETNARLRRQADPFLTHDVDASAMEFDTDINFRVERKAEVSVPGTINPTDAVGILNGDKSASPISLPAPGGFELGGYRPRGLPLAGSFFGRSGAIRGLALRDVSPAKGHPSWIYGRPAVGVNDRIFFDLLSYTPGMMTSAADVEAVIEAEAAPSPYSKLGKIDPKAEALIIAARQTGWHAWKLPDDKDQAGYTIHFDATGRCVFERVLSPGFTEQVAADGETLLHLYPQLHVGARRDLSRFHVSELASMIPWIVPSAADLARGADLKLVGDRTVAIVSHGEAAVLAGIKKAKENGAKDDAIEKIEWARLHLVFGESGQLAERQVVSMPKNKVIYRQILEAGGTVKLLDGDGKELSVRRGTLTKSEAPAKFFEPAKDMVVLSLPYRTAEHVKKTLKIENKSLDQLRLAEALPLFASYIGAGNGNEALAFFQRTFAAREQKQLGYYVLLASCGVNLDGQNVDVMAEHLEEPLAQYLALHSSPVLRKHASQWAVKSGSWNDAALQHLATTHAFYQRWQSDKVTKGDPTRVKAEWQRAFDYVKKNQNAFGWTLLNLMQDRAAEARDYQEELAKHFTLFENYPGVSYAARYEAARSLLRAGQTENSGRLFKALYERTFKDDILPAIDGDFRKAVMVIHKDQRDGWSALMRETTSQLITKKKRPAVLALAWQCWQLDDQPLASTLFGMALAGIAEPKEKTAMTLAGIDFLWETNQVAQADALLSTLLADPELAKKPALWRMAVKFADHRDMPARSLECQEKALELEYQHLPELVNLENIRREYGRLLGNYDKLTEAMLTLKVKPGPDYFAKVIRAADRWRALEIGAAQPCDQTAWILQRLGDKELAWDYLTTPLAFHPNEAEPWKNLAGQLTRRGDLTLADRAYEAAFHAEPTNPQLLWDRAQNLKRLGKTADATRLYQQIADGRWQPRFTGLQNQAKAEAGN